MPNLENLKSAIQDITISSFRSNPPPASYEGKQIELNFATKCSTAISHDLTDIRIIIAITVTPKDNKQVELLFVETYTVFPVLNMKEWEKNDKIELPKELWAALINTAVGTARGVMLAYSSSSLFGKVVVPILNIQELIPKDVFDLKPAREKAKEIESAKKQMVS